MFGEQVVHRNVTGDGEERQVEARRTIGGTQRSSCYLQGSVQKHQDQVQGQKWMDPKENWRPTKVLTKGRDLETWDEDIQV